MAAILADAAAILGTWAAMMLVELLALGFAWSEQFSGVWEITLARRLALPIALAGLTPATVAVAASWRVAQRAAAGQRGARLAVGSVGAAAAGALAVGLSHGRHFTSWEARAPFVLALACLGGAAGPWVAGRLSALRRRPGILAMVGITLAVGAWIADEDVLPRLYPAFHVAMLVTSLLGAALAALGARSALATGERASWAMAGAGTLVALGCVCWTPHASRALEPFTNLRIALVEHAPLLGPAVILEGRLRAHRPSLDDGNDGSTNGDSGNRTAASLVPAEVARSLDWTHGDMVLITIDALRADHVSAYGYGRATTPAIDALARQGTLFEAAYCPTPHTSYSLTSMMTGKYLRPLLALGLGQDSETWAQDLRRYGWRTAAFYPPAVFFIDEGRFAPFEQTRLGFEYAKVEFADPALRERQVDAYLATASREAPVFLWVHLFEPHEPYVVHPEHVFTGGRSADLDAYDSEIATADDGVGRIVGLVRARSPNAVVVVTADHGEEFGEHGGRYHGTTVYEEQVRVPLVIVGPGVRAGARVKAAVQTIDLLPTVLSALGIPRSARLRGRDLGPLLTGDPKALDTGFAFAETDDYALVASGDDRLICERRAAACALYQPADDPLERRDVSRSEPARFVKLRAMLDATERDAGRYENAGPSWPEPIRRGLQGDADAAVDVASLLDDAEVEIRRKAAEICYVLHVPSTTPQVTRALARDEDDGVRRWSALALARMGGPISPLAEALLADSARDWRRRAALALAERGQARACDEIASWWGEVLPKAGQGNRDGEPPRLAIDLPHTQELLAATARAGCRTAVPALVRALDDVRARPYVADALGTLGDRRARDALLTLLAREPYVTTRPHEARALLALGVFSWSGAASAEVHATLSVPTDAKRLIVLLTDGSAKLESSGGAPSEEGDRSDGTVVREVDLEPAHGRRVRVDLRASTGKIVALWAVPSGRLD